MLRIGIAANATPVPSIPETTAIEAMARRMIKSCIL
jgi:hypothetical protein